MTDLPEVRRADCGHGFIPIDIPASARVQNGQHEQDVYLCDDCRARLNRPRVETKPATRSETKVVETGHVSVVRDERGRPLVSTPTSVDLNEHPAFRGFSDSPPAERGRIAAVAGDPRKVPDDLGHARGAPAREWLAGYDGAKGHG